jgi:hypothetical protein
MHAREAEDPCYIHSVKGSTPIPYYVRACALGLPAYLGGVHLWSWIVMGSTFAAGVGGFSTFYMAGYFVRSGQVRSYTMQQVNEPFSFPFFQHACDPKFCH